MDCSKAFGACLLFHWCLMWTREKAKREMARKRMIMTKHKTNTKTSCTTTKIPWTTSKCSTENWCCLFRFDSIERLLDCCYWSTHCRSSCSNRIRHNLMMKSILCPAFLYRSLSFLFARLWSLLLTCHWLANSILNPNQTIHLCCSHCSCLFPMFLLDAVVDSRSIVAHRC